VATGQLGLELAGKSGDEHRYFIFPGKVRLLEDIVPAAEAAFKAMADKVGQEKARKRGVVIDDVTQRASASLGRYFTEAESIGEGQNWAYQKLKAKVAQMMEGVCALGIPIGMSFHINEPSRDKANRLTAKGGLDCGSRGRAGAVGGHMDLIMFGYTDPTVVELWSTARVRGRAKPQDPEWETGDRFGSAFDGQPFNVREHVNASPVMDGKLLPRLPDLMWQEDVATHIADVFLQENLRVTSPLIEAVRGVFAKHGTGSKIREILTDPRDLRVRWAVQDGMDRARYREAMNRDLFANFSESDENDTL
jgi:hypothetical protein